MPRSLEHGGSNPPSGTLIGKQMTAGMLLVGLAGILIGVEILLSHCGYRFHSYSDIERVRLKIAKTPKDPVQFKKAREAFNDAWHRAIRRPFTAEEREWLDRGISEK